MRDLVVAAFVCMTACGPGPAKGPQVVPGQQYPIDAQFLAAHLTWEFAASSSQCFHGLVAALDDIGIERQDETTLEVVSKRYTFDVNATYTTTGTDVSTTSTTNADGSTSRSNTTTPYRRTEHSLARQSVQYFFRVRGDAERCTVEAFDWKAWSGEERMRQLQREGIDWTREHLFEPLHESLYDEIQAARSAR